MLVVSIFFNSIYCSTSAIVLLVCLALWGSFRFYFNGSTTYDTAFIDNLEQRISFELPDTERLITEDRFYYTQSVGKFSEEDAVIFEQKIKESDVWMGKPKIDRINQFGQMLDKELSKYDYCLIYNEIGQYYYGSQDRIYWDNCILMAYRADTKTFIIMYDFKRV